MVSNMGWTLLEVDPQSLRSALQKSEMVNDVLYGNENER